MLRFSSVCWTNERVSPQLANLVLCLSCIWSWLSPGRLSRDGSWLPQGGAAWTRTCSQPFLTTCLGHWLCLPYLRWHGPLLSQGRLEQVVLGSRQLAQGCGGQRISVAVLSRRAPSKPPSRALLTAALWKEQWTRNQEVSRWKTELHRFSTLWPRQVT